MSRWWISKRRSDEFALHRITRYKRRLAVNPLLLFVIIMAAVAVAGIAGYLIGKGSGEL